MTNRIRILRWLPVAALAAVADVALAADGQLAEANDWLLSGAVMVALAVMFYAIFNISGAVNVPSRSGPRRQLLPRS